MRSFIGGLLGLCLGLALLPQDASARTDARSSAQSSQSSRTTTAATRPATARPSTTTRTSSASRPAATTQRQALAPRSTTSSRSAQRAGTSRQAAAVPYARQPATTNTRGLRQTAVATCTTRNGRRTCAPAATRTASMRWTGGLAPAAFSQTGCPDGTIATMAIGHNDITRCVPL
ncbi:hypothetical protein KTR66_16465 [Roseococcus sp. SDR]|uniref:hypothetical protein n=1 Tax=Roseococcus sp. SDR TaxID=2835532 RepID=UPI001BCA965E|nr:hypothetical protein [Roseococcus sp. SDR]MBS7791598.1 hypothetical protein [Roseococcus sp. SDR]MBV1846912.1 hypothetical protein [Roseococcus sp. SDR]